MASSRISRSGSARSGSGRRRSPPPSSDNTQMIVVGVGVVVVALIGVFFLFGGGVGGSSGDAGDTKNKQERTPPAKEAVADKEPAKPVPAVMGSGRPGKTPDRVAPAITEADVQRAEALYKEAKDLDLRARKAQKKGDSGQFNQLINDSWDKIEAAFRELRVYDEWLDEAEMEDWAIPASYVRFQKRIENLERLQGRVKRIRPMRRR